MHQSRRLQRQERKKMRTDVYRSKAWKTIRRTVWISQHCICARCGRAVYVDGLTDYLPKEKRLKGIVHHKTHLTESNYTDDAVAYSMDNLEGLCIDCHNQEHFTTQATRGGLRFDDNGDVVVRPSIRRDPSPAQSSESRSG